jgi:hypothetical protein
MAVKLGLLARLQAKPGKGDELGAFLKGGRALAVAEEGTVTWYAMAQVASDLLASEPDIQPIDVIAVK